MIGLILARKWKRMTQMSTQPFWGVFHEVFGVCFLIWALEVPLLALENGHFHSLYGAKTENGWQIFVYGSIILKKNLVALLTYTHHWLTAISKI